MTLKQRKKILIIVIPIITVVIMAFTLLMLYLNTDFLKSDKTLFLKYMSQNMEVAKAVLDNTSEKELTNILRQSKYESTAELSGVYTEKINTSEENKDNDINKLKIISENQSEYLNNYNSKNIKILYNDTDLLKLEYIHEDDMYGIRFPERFNQYLATSKDKIKEIANRAGLTEEQMAIIPDTIEEFEYNKIFSFTDEELASIQERYINIINENISNDKYSKQNDAMITVGQTSYNTTAYSITINQEQANDIYIKMLEQLKTDETILNKIEQLEPIAIVFNSLKEGTITTNDSYIQELLIEKIDQTIKNIRENNIGTSEVKYTVYVTNGKTIRTQILEETRQLIIDNNKTDEGIEVEIQNKTANHEKENEQNLKIVNNSNGNESNFTISAETILGEETKEIEIYRNKVVSDDTAKITTGIRYDDGNDNLLNLKFDENFRLNENFERKLEFDDSNCVVANNYEEAQVTSWINQIKEFIDVKLKENQQIITNIKKIPIVGNIFGEPKETPIEGEEAIITEVDKNRFNARFEFYSGKEKSYEEVVKLLEESKTSLKGAQVSYSNEGSTEENKKLQAVKITIENGVKNVEIADEIIRKLDENRKYNVEIIKNSNDFVQTITITTNQ